MIVSYTFDELQISPGILAYGYADFDYDVDGHEVRHVYLDGQLGPIEPTHFAYDSILAALNNPHHRERILDLIRADEAETSHSI